jgi:hypothetical protein
MLRSESARVPTTVAWFPAPELESALRRLRDAWIHAPAALHVVYIEGPPGTGKSALVRRFIDELADLPSVYTTHAGTIPADRHLVSAELAQGLGNGSDRRDRVPLWVVEDYHAWRPVHAWLQSALAESKFLRGMVIFEGREPFRRLWSGDTRSHATVIRIILEPWNRETSDAYLASRNFPSLWRSTALDIGDGIPLILGRMADAVAADGTGVLDRDLTAVASFLVERALHPASRRTVWRAGLGDRSLDAVVAPALTFPFFTRRWLETLIEPGLVEHHWSELTSLPVVDAVGPGVFRFRPAFRQVACPLVFRQRPWSVAVWERRLLERSSHTDATGTEATVAEYNLAELMACLVGGGTYRPVTGSITWRPVAEAGTPSYEVTISDSQDAPLVSAMVEWPPPPAPVRLTVFHKPPKGEEAAALIWGAVAAHVFFARPTCRLVLWEPDNVPMPAGLANMRELIMPCDINGWMAACLSAPAVSPDLVRQLLTLLSDTNRLHSVAQLGLPTGRDKEPSAERIRLWLTDAILALEAEDAPHLPPILSLYYLKRRGSHEAIAELIGISRATYFRLHARAIQLLAQRLTEVLSPRPAFSAPAEGMEA